MSGTVEWNYEPGGILLNMDMVLVFAYVGNMARLFSSIVETERGDGVGIVKRY